MQLSSCIFYMLSRSARSGTRFYKKQLEDLNLTPVQSIVLQALAMDDGCSTSDLSRAAELDNATLTGVLDRLEHAEFVTRKPDPDDRRRQRIHLTTHGAEIARQLDELTERANAEFLKDLNPAETAELKRLLDRL